jgi:hypothetical protein
MPRPRLRGAARPLPPPSQTYTTRQVAEYFERPLHDVYNAVADGRIPSPPRNSVGRLTWRPLDINRLRLVLAIDRRTKAHRRPRGKAVRS